MDAISMERALIEDQEEMASHWQRQRAPSQVTEVSDMIDERLSFANANSVPLPKFGTKSTNDSAVDSENSYANAEPHLVVCGEVQSISDTYVTVRQRATLHTGRMGKNEPQKTFENNKKSTLWSIETINIPYTHLIYALGSHLPDPLRHDSYTKADGIWWMQRMQKRIEESREIVVIGGGALGVELASDIACRYELAPNKKLVTLIHSRQQLLPNFDIRTHEVAYKRLKELGVNVVLGHRLALTEGCPMGSSVEQIDKRSKATIKPITGTPLFENDAPTRQRIRTTGGLEMEADLLLMCTGQQPNSGIMTQYSPTSVSHHTRLIRVMPSLNVMLPHDGDALQQPFDAVPPCFDCDCFLDKKAESDYGKTAYGNDVLSGCLPNIYAIGDVADAFGALNAGYQAWFMADVAAENILRDIMRVKSSDTPDDKVPDGEPVPKQEFKPGPPLLKLTVGLNFNVVQGAPAADESTPGEPMRPTISITDETEDLGVEAVWRNMALADTSDMHL